LLRFSTDTCKAWAILIDSITVSGNAPFTVTPVIGLDAGTYTATVVSGVNNIFVDLDVSFTVNKASGAAVSVPTASSVTSTSITVNTVTVPGNGQTVEYAISTSNSAPSSGWQTGTTFSGLISGTAYYIFARYYNAGTASSGYRIPTIGAGTQASPIHLTENVWEDGRIASSSSEAWYSFTAAAGTTYRVYLSSDSYPSGSTVYLKVTQNPSSAGTGTFAIVYSTGSTRP